MREEYKILFYTLLLFYLYSFSFYLFIYFPTRIYQRYPSQATGKNLLVNNRKWHPTKFVADDEDTMAI